MASIRLTEFGGLFPSVPPRRLKEEAAQVATDLLASAREFRPLGADTTVVANSGVNNPGTIYRFARTDSGAFNTDMTTGWVVSADQINYVRGPVEGTDERTYYAYLDGETPPRVRDVNNDDRQLGVPAPSTAPTFEVNVVDEFTVEDRASELTAALQAGITAIRDSVTPVWRGAEHPGTSTTGYLDQTVANGAPVEHEGNMGRIYRLTGQGGTVSDAYSDVADSEFSWIFDPALGGIQAQSTGTPAWSGSAGTWHLAILFRAYGRTYDIDSGAVSTALAAVNMPGTSDGTKLLTSGQVSEVVALLEDYADPDGPLIKPKIDALASKVTELKAVLDGGMRTSLSSSVQAFYSKTDVTDAINDAIAVFADQVYSAAYDIARASLPPDYYNP